jgi:hypothetical protein
MGELKEYILDRLTIILVGLNAILQYVGVENIKSTILWILTITLLVFKIRSEFLKYKCNKEELKIALKIKEEELKLKIIENFNLERDNFFKTRKNENNADRDRFDKTL